MDKNLAKALARGDGTHGKGPGGLGENSAAGQSLRWTLRFRTRSPRSEIRGGRSPLLAHRTAAAAG